MMVKKQPQFSIETRALIVAMQKEGLSQVAISKKIKCSRYAVQTAIRRYATTSLKNMPGSGRKRKTTVRMDRKIIRISLRNRKKTSSEIAAELKNEDNVEISPVTVRRRLREANLKGCKARRKPLLSKKNIRERLEWARNHRSWTPDDWAKVLWSDETNVEIFGSPGAVYVRRRVGKEYRPDCIVPTVKFGGGSVMFWGCMSSGGVGKMFVCDGRMNASTYTAMLDEVLKPSIEKLFNKNERKDVIFQQDNAPCHTAKASLTYFKNKNINVMDWPPQSPDLNPIENIWRILKTNVKKRQPSSRNDLIAIVMDEWQKLGRDVCAKLIISMPKRVNNVIKAKGYHTKY